MPETLTPEQMVKLQGGSQPSQDSLPPVLSVQDMLKFQPPNAQQSSTQAVPDSTTGSTADFIGKALNTVEQPFVNVAAIPVQLGVAASNALTGNKTPDPYAQGLNVNRSLTNEPIPVSSVTAPKGWLQKAGSAGQIAATALSPGVSSVKGFATLGAGSALSQSLQSGETDPHQLTKDTIYGGLFGAAMGVMSGWLQGVGALEKGKTGVVGQVEQEIQGIDEPLLKSYIDATKSHATNIRAATPDALAETEFRNRASTLIEKTIPDAGEKVGEARAAAAKLPVTFVNPTTGLKVEGPEAVNSVMDDINGVMQKLTGHEFSSYSSGGEGMLKINYPGGATTAGIEPVEGAISQIPGRTVQLSPAEIKQLENIDRYLKTLSENPTVQTASDQLINIDNDIGKWSKPIYGENAGNTPVEGVLRYARGAINRIIAPSSPEIAQANARYSELMDLKAAIGAEAGTRGQNASLAMRRVLSGDQAADIIPMLDQLDAATSAFRPNDKSTLVQHATVAWWAKNTLGDPSTKTLLNQYINRDINDTSTLFGQTKYLIKAGMQRTLGAFSPDPAKYALSVARGEPQSMNVLVRGIDRIVDSAKGIKLINKFASSLKTLGVTSENVEGTAKTLFKVWLIQQLTSPKQPQPQQSGPSVIMPPGINRSLTQ